MVRKLQGWKILRCLLVFIVIYLTCKFLNIFFNFPLAALWSKINYTATIYHQTFSRCFPNYPAVAELVLLFLPYLLLTAFVLTLAFKTARLLSEKTKSLANTFSNIGGRLFTAPEYNSGLVKQVLMLAAYTSVFCLGYYALQHRFNSNAYLFGKLQIAFTHVYLALLALHLFSTLYYNRYFLKPFAIHFFTESGSAYNLAIFRILIFNGVLGWYQYELSANSFWAAMPHQYRVSLPGMGWFIQNIPISPALYTYACYTGIACAIMGMAGLGTRFFTLLNIPLSIYIMGVPMFFGKMFHLQIWVWFPALLALSPCADVLSLDWALRKYFLKKPRQPVHHPKYFLPLKIVWLHLGIIYFFAGWMKLQNAGFAWALSDSIINQMQVEWTQHYNLVPAFRIDLYPALVHTMGIAVILFEMLFIFLVFSPVGRWLCAIGGLTMHYFINYFMYIDFKDLQRTYVSLINWAGVYEWLQKKIGLGPPEKKGSAFTIPQLLQVAGFRYVFIIGLGMFSINLLCGAFQVHSWPFSSYPTYSMLIGPTHHYVYFEAYNRTGNFVDVYAAGEKAHFRMESYTPIEDRIYENTMAGDTAVMNNNTLKLWEIWRSNVPALAMVDTVAFYIRTAPVAPERANQVLEQHFIGGYRQKNQ